MTDITPERLVTIRALHFERGGGSSGFCVCCNHWPCDAIQLADALLARDREVERLREALERIDYACQQEQDRLAEWGIEAAISLVIDLQKWAQDALAAQPLDALSGEHATEENNG